MSKYVIADYLCQIRVAIIYDALLNGAVAAVFALKNPF